MNLKGAAAWDAAADTHFNACSRQTKYNKSQSFAPNSDYIKVYAQLYGGHKRRDQFCRDLLPEPQVYYKQHLPHLKIRNGWSDTRCLFHEDNHASLSVSLIHGGYICHACGVKGGDVLDFHRRLTGMTFVDAAKDLGAWGGCDD